MRSKHYSLAFVALSTGWAAIAAPPTQPGQPSSHWPVDLSWEQFVQACLDPASANMQIAPKDISITCDEKVRTWRPLDEIGGLGGNPGGPGGPGTPGTPGSPGKEPKEFTDLKSSRLVTSKVDSSKARVNAYSKDYSMPAVQVPIPKYQEVERTLSISRAVSCDDVKKFGVDVNTFCEQALNDARKQGADVKETPLEGHIIKLQVAQSYQNIGTPSELRPQGGTEGFPSEENPVGETHRFWKHRR